MIACRTQTFSEHRRTFKECQFSGLGTDKNPTKALYSDTTKSEIFFVETRTLRKAKMINVQILLKSMHTLIILKS